MIKKNRIFLVISNVPTTLTIITTYLYMFFVSTSNLGIKDIVEVKVPWIDIFIHNAIAAVMTIILGNITIGLGSVLMFMFNVYLISYSALFAYSVSGSIGYSFFILMVHGTFEIPAIVICFLLSTSTLRIMLNKIFDRNFFYINNIREKFFLAGLMFFLYLVASVIEAYLTSYFANIFI